LTQMGKGYRSLIYFSATLSPSAYYTISLRIISTGPAKKGYDYAYVYPGMNKVLQAGGRLIRSEQDSGVLVLVDDRYLQQQYQRLLSEEWNRYKVIKPNGPGDYA
jgi:Rad3-related DNA helicase